MKCILATVLKEVCAVSAEDSTTMCTIRSSNSRHVVNELVCAIAVDRY